MQWLTQNWQAVGTALLLIAEGISLFIKGNGTIDGIISALKNAGIKNPS